MAVGVDVRIEGAEVLARVARAVKAHGDAQLRKDLLRGLRNATKPMIASIKDEARASLPAGGGLNDLVAASKISARSRTTGTKAGVRLVGKSAGHDLAAINRGRLRHPVFGHPVWVSQTVAAGWWEDGANKKADTVSRDLVAVMRDVLAEIARSA
jgi:hypothetical protein